MYIDDRTRVLHMRDAARAAIEFISGRTRPDLDKDRMLQFAVVRALEIIGEAAAGVSEEGRARAAQIPWRVIVSTRNRVIRGYFSMNTELIWNTVSVDLPVLISELDALLNELETAPDQR